MRETGPVAKVLRVDGKDASDQDVRRVKPYIGPARTLLGTLKNQMELGGLELGKMYRDYPDGTKVIVESRYGLDKMTIIAPAEEQERGEEENPPIDVPTSETPIEPPLKDDLEANGLVICGDAGSVAWVWRHGDADVTVLPHASGCDTSNARAICADGSVVVGRSYNSAGDPVYAVRWHRDEGGWQVEVIGEGGPMDAQSISKDGTVIAGVGIAAVATDPYDWAPGSTPVRCWFWTRGTGLVVLPNSNGSAIIEVGARVSSSARYLAGGIDHPNPEMGWVGPSFPDHDVPYIPFLIGQPNDLGVFYNKGAHGARWERAGDTYASETELYDGFSFTTFSDIEFPFYPTQVYTYDNSYTPNITGVSDNGKVVGVLDEHGFVWDGGFTYLDEHPRVDSHDSDTQDYQQPTCISADGARIGGTTFSIDDLPNRAWVRTDEGVRDLGEGGVLGMSDDGRWLVGYSGSDAVYWPYASGVMQVIPSYNGEVMEATDVGRANISIDEDGRPRVTDRYIGV